MNANDYGSLPNKKTSTDSGLYGNGSVYSRPQQAQGYPYQPNSYAPRENGMVNSCQNMQSTSRPVYDSATSNGSDRSYAARNNGYSRIPSSDAFFITGQGETSTPLNPAFTSCARTAARSNP